MLKRRDFVRDAAMSAALLAAGRAFAQAPGETTGDARLDALQHDIDKLTPEDFKAYYAKGSETPADEVAAWRKRFACLDRLETAFEKVYREAQETVVTDANRPAVWYVYNMGFIVKTRESLFSIDLMHRRGEEFAPFLDFALITHNHRDHYTERFKVAMDRKEHKTVVNNFFDNYGATPWKEKGGFTRAAKEFAFKDVKVLTALTDHNDYLVDYTTTFEIHVGDFTIFHSGDCSNWRKLNSRRQPDLWMVHPYCGMDPVVAARETVHPKNTLIAHLHELHHPYGKARWSFCVGQEVKRNLAAAGYDADFPLWGARVA